MWRQIKWLKQPSNIDFIYFDRRYKRQATKDIDEMGREKRRATRQDNQWEYLQDETSNDTSGKEQWRATRSATYILEERYVYRYIS